MRKRDRWGDATLLSGVAAKQNTGMVEAHQSIRRRRRQAAPPHRRALMRVAVEVSVSQAVAVVVSVSQAVARGCPQAGQLERYQGAHIRRRYHPLLPRSHSHTRRGVPCLRTNEAPIVNRLLIRASP